MLSEFQIQEIKSELVRKSIQVLVSFGILLVAHVIGSQARKAFFNNKRHRYNDTSADGQDHARKVDTIYVTFSQMIYYIIIVLAFLIVLRIFGIEIASIVALLGASSIAIGLALQGTLNDIASSILLALFDVYRIGDVVQLDNMIGRVHDFNIMHTVIEDIDSEVTYIVPNRRLKDEVITNYTRKKMFVAVIKVLVSNQNVDFPKIFRLIETATKDIPATQGLKKIYVDSMSSAGTSITVKAAIRAKDFPDVVEDIQTSIREVLAVNGIKMIDVDIFVS
jgi:small conductance mechanosensitive channel